MTDQHEKGAAFRALHEGETFVIPNPWDLGSARILAALGFRALATTSSGFAFTLGRLDGSADAGRGRRTRPRAGGRDRSARLGRSRERLRRPGARDRRRGRGGRGRRLDRGLRPGRRAVSGGRRPRGRLAAAVEAARALDFPFVLTGRAENHIRGNPDLDDTDRAPAGVRGGGRGRAVRAGPGERRRDPRRCARPSRARSTCSRGRTCRCRRSRAPGGRRISLGGALAWSAVAGFVAAAERIRDRRRFLGPGVAGAAAGVAAVEALERRLGRAAREPPLAAVRGALPLWPRLWNAPHRGVRNVRRLLFSSRYAPPTGTASNRG